MFQVFSGVLIAHLLLLLSLLSLILTSEQCTVLARHDGTLLEGSQLPIDTAQLTVIAQTPVDIYVQTEECFKCELSLQSQNSTHHTLLIDTRWKVRYKINSSSSIEETTRNCNGTRHFLEHGIYELSFHTCFLETKHHPSSSFIALYVATAILITLAVLWILVSKFLWNRVLRQLSVYDLSENEPLITERQNVVIGPDGSLERGGLISSVGGGLTSSTEVHVSPRVNGDNTGRPKKERLKSLDTFRGISIVIMIFVNYGGGKYWFFNHSKWNGLTVADLVFPWFIFIMGTSMVYSFKSLKKNKTPKYKIFLKIFRRSCTLFLLGLVINTNGCSSVVLKEIRILGVLQRFALTYLVVATMHMFMIDKKETANPRERRFKDITDYWVEWLLMVSVLLIHTMITFLLKVDDGCEKGYLGPGGLHDGGKHFKCTGGAAGYIDRKLFGEKHVYSSPTSKEIYHSKVHYDPEGFLGTLTSCFLCFLGLQAGKIFIIHKDRKARVIRFLFWGFVLCLLAGILCKFSKNDGWIPVNKNLWSLSFVLCLGGFAFLLLCTCYILIDEKKIWNGAPFYYPGMNAIIIYMGHELLHNNFPISWSVPETHASQLALNLYGVSFWVVVSTYLFYKGDFYVI